MEWQPGDAVGEAPKQGLYMFGQVGRGKSMLMDLFFQSVPIERKKRVHFHEFMRDIHRQMHEWRQDNDPRLSDPIPKLARASVDTAWLLCFDELQVTDIGDAMIVGRLFQAMMDEGVVLVITSNRAPSDLYKDGLQRERFLPFIHLIESRLDLLQLDAAADYRLGRDRGVAVFHIPDSTGASVALDEMFDQLCQGQAARPDRVEINGRVIEVPSAAGQVARFSFTDLCARPLGASDYLAIAQRYGAVLVDGVPLLSPAARDEAKRFVTLIDALYEAKTLFICSAAAPPEALYPHGDGAFEFQRTASRLMEMQSSGWVDAALARFGM